MIIIPFALPKVGPKDLKELRAFQSLKILRKAASSAIAWSLSLGAIFNSTAKEVIGRVLLPKVQDSLPGMDQCMVMGYGYGLCYSSVFCKTSTLIV